MNQQDLLKKEKKEHDRKRVLDIQSQAFECARARIQWPENRFIEAAFQISAKKAAKLYARFLDKYGEHPMMPVRLEAVEGA